MRKKSFMLALAVLTAAGSILLEINAPDRVERYYQHQYAELPREEEIAASLNCIHPSEEVSHYDADAVNVDELSTHLPLVVIHTREIIPGKAYYSEETSQTKYTLANDGETTVIGEMKVMDKEGRMHRVSDAPDLNTNIRIRVRGNSSRWFDKSSYAIRTIDAGGENRKVKIMGMEEHHEWALHGPFLDKSLIRNYVGLNLSGTIMDYAPDVRLCEVVVNGNYQGVYAMMETVTAGEGRAKVGGINRQKNMTGYIFQFDVQRDKPKEQLDNFSKYSWNLKADSYVKLEYPGRKELTPQLKTFVEKDLSQFEKALYSFDYDTGRYGYKKYADVEEFADYIILMELFEQQDTGKLSTYYYKEINGRFKPCVWDFNNCSDNFSVNTTDDYHIRQFVTVQAPWFLMMMKDDAFTEYVIRRYHALRRNILTDEFIEAFIDGTVKYLGPAADRNWAVWGYSFNPENLDTVNKLSPDERNPENYEAAVNQFRSSLLERAHWLDQNIEILRQYSHESAVKKYNH